MHSNIKKRFNNLLPRYAILPIIAALLINNCIYIGAAQLRNHLSFYSLAISLDEKIPLLTPFVIFYVLAYVQWALNYILIGRDSKKLCYQFVLGDILSILQNPLTPAGLNYCLFSACLYIVSNHSLTGAAYGRKLKQKRTDIWQRFSHCLFAFYQLCRCSCQPILSWIHCLESWCCIRRRTTK